MKSFKCYINEEISHVATIPKGGRLFHGSLENFIEADLTVGGYDKILWTTKEPAIAQSYIPKAGLTIYVSSRTVANPSKNEIIQDLQKHLGFEYNMNKVEWDEINRPKSFYAPKGWHGKASLPTEEEIYQLLKEKEFQEKNYDFWIIYASSKNKNKILLPSEKNYGRLFILTAKEPIKFYDTTLGGEREGDLTDLDYHKLDWFKSVQDKGYDGIIINDFAQIDDMGNFGHTSYGIFKDSIKKLEWVTIPATHPENFCENNYKTGDYNTPEYNAFLKG
jgi:hypothetical protein